MEDCHTPNFKNQIGFQLNYTPSLLADVNRYQEIQNLKVNQINMRCYTPTFKNFHSPGLSPIYDLNNLEMGSPVAAMEQEQLKFKKPTTVKVDKRLNLSPIVFLKQKQKQKQQQQLKATTNWLQRQPTPPTQQQQQQQQQQQRQRQQLQQQEKQLNSSVDLMQTSSSSESSSSDLDYSNLNSTINVSTLSNILNRTLSVHLLLKNIGLSEYSELFEREGIDYEQFLNIKRSDLKNIGLFSEEHCEQIMELLKDLNK